MPATLVTLRLPDASTTALRLYDAGPAGDKPLVVVWPGWGVGSRYYDPIAGELASRGYPVAIGELRGQGSSTAAADRHTQWSYHTMASEDYPLTIRTAKEHFGLPADYPVVMLCHSMGGQIGSLFLSREESKELNVQGLMGVGTGTPYWRGFDGKTKARILVGHVYMKAMVKLFGYHPSGRLDLSGYGLQAGAHVLDWIKFSQTNTLHHLRFADRDYMDTLREDVHVPVLLTFFGNDRDCPRASAENMAKLMKKAFVRCEEYPADVPQLGHNRWARDPVVVANRFEDFVAQIEAGRR